MSRLLDQAFTSGTGQASWLTPLGGVIVQRAPRPDKAQLWVLRLMRFPEISFREEEEGWSDSTVGKAFALHLADLI